MTAREEFNHMLNSYEHPRAIYNALMSLVNAIVEEKPSNPRAALLEAVKGGAQA